MTLRGRLGPLVERDFRLLFAATTVTTIGDRLALIALTFAVLDAGSTTDLGIVLGSRQAVEAVVLVFGYTRCPDVCPMTLGRLVQLRTRLGKAAERVRVVFVTLDPERDTAARLLAYTRWFDPTFVGLTGTPKAVARVRDAYGVVAGRRAAPGTAEYLVDHSTFVFVVDPAGQLRFMFPGGVSVEEMIQGIAPLLQ